MAVKFNQEPPPKWVTSMATALRGPPKGPVGPIRIHTGAYFEGTHETG